MSSEYGKWSVCWRGDIVEVFISGDIHNRFVTSVSKGNSYHQRSNSAALFLDSFNTKLKR